MRIRTLAALALLAPLAASCGGDGGSTRSTSLQDGFRVGDDTPVPPGARTIEVIGYSFGYTPEEIVVARGEAVALSLYSSDTLHDLVSDEIDVYAYAHAGETAVGGFTAPNEPGRYQFWCTIPGHRDAGMEGWITVE